MKYIILALAISACCSHPPKRVVPKGHKTSAHKKAPKVHKTPPARSVKVRGDV